VLVHRAGLAFSRRCDLPGPRWPLSQAGP
jgi:hypothetical protein